MNANIKSIFKKYLDQGANIKEKEKLTKELEEIEKEKHEKEEQEKNKKTTC